MPLDPSFTLPPLTVTDPRICIGDYTYADGRPYLIVYNPSDRIWIGKFCSLAYEITIFGGGNHRADWVSQYPMRVAFKLDGAGEDGHPCSNGPVIIDNDVYIGYRAIIMSGASIRNGAVVGAGSVVTSSSCVPPYSIVAGNPAKVIKFRFSEDIIQELEQIAWWNWPIEEIKKAIPYLSSHRIDDFIEYSNKRNT